MFFNFFFFFFLFFFFFFNDTATTEIYTLSLHDALPIPFATVSPRSASARADGGSWTSSSPTSPATRTASVARPTAIVTGAASAGRRCDHGHVRLRRRAARR